ncbi:SubName: Full=Uncharacterized protein {ECO:0000313/EMBL:CCA66623.1} [Serendipita indica DSM 11827]|uniref:Uncharacterized protein n=1 Tax=Serendipita indica (strain DSM 11827) TaxID=1109443 RepID=G4T5J4_SERID|nr:SubName: Full=Uncharacterized protein {ECO:0000313/EMBL:CCA66623.1} [Serendipita indica DSM 11827]CCA66623.1 hypothetical protein PIIN_00306 [Serendipita indica DSM 11827]
MSVYKITVAQYGSDRLHGAWHYAILCYTLSDPHEPERALCLQLVGSEGVRNYEIGEVSRVVARHSKCFQGEIVVGHIASTSSAVQHFKSCAKLVQIQNGTREWNSQNWVAEVLTVANTLGVQVNAYTHKTLFEAMKSSFK